MAAVNGNGWTNGGTGLRLLVDSPDPSTGQKIVTVVRGNEVLAAFTKTYVQYPPPPGYKYGRMFGPDWVMADDGSGGIVITDGAGNAADFTGVDAAGGGFQKMTYANGTVVQVVSRNGAGAATEMQRTETVGGQTVTDSVVYTFGTNGQVSNTLLRRQTGGGGWVTVRQEAFAYHDGTTTAGSANDLKSAAVEDAAGNLLEGSYFRYYKAGDANGYPGGVKIALTGTQYTRAVSVLGANLDAATDAQLAPYADAQYQYDAAGRVTQATLAGAGCSACTGGQGTYMYTYATSTNGQDPNQWMYQTTAARPDGSTETVYLNGDGEVMGRAVTAGGVTDATYDRYDANGDVVLEAAPSAVTKLDPSLADLVGYNTSTNTATDLAGSAGKITVTAYGTSTTATGSTPGDVAGYVKTVSVKQGTTGTAVKQSDTLYTAHTAGSATVYPVAQSTTYRNADGTGAETTTSAYTFLSGTNQVAQTTTTPPTVTSTQNGPGAAAPTVTVDDADGRPVWAKDAGGYISYTAYDSGTGAVVKRITDVDTTKTTDFANLPAGWTTPAGGGLHLITTYQVDALGRATKTTSPAGNVAYTVYNDTAHETLTYPGWNTSTNTPTGPTRVTRDDRANGYTESFTMTAAPNVTGGAPDGTEAVAGLQSLTRSYRNAAGQVTSEYAYFNLAGLAYSTGTMGTQNTNYYLTQTGYDDAGRQNKTVSPAGTITRTVSDGQGRVVSTWIGTNDTPGSGYWSPTNNTAPSNMVDVTDYQYDGGGVGDGNQTQVTQHPGLGAADRVTQTWYDWRDRAVAVKQGVSVSEADGTNRPLTVTTYDNLGEATETQRYAGDGVTPGIVNGVLSPSSIPAADLRAQAVTSYDELGRAYQAQQYDVNPTTGAVSSTALTTNTYYDLRGNTIATSAPGGQWTKTQYDGAGRSVMQYTTDGAGGTTWAAAGGVSSDTVLTQSQTIYDADSNPIETVTSDRFDSASGTGALGTPTTGVNARVSYAASYYDAADRDVADVTVGTNGGAAWTRPGTVPARSATVLVTSTGYDAAGRVQAVTDPLGLVTQTSYDALDRTTQTIQDYTTGTPTTTSNKTTNYAYGPAGMTGLTAVQPAGSGPSQTTAWVYGVTAGSGGSAITSNDVKAVTEWPDPTTGAASTTLKDTLTVDAVGDTATATDRNGTVHTYTYDVLGRPTADAVTTLGTGVDGSVRRIATAYDGQGNPYLVTSYNAASGGTVVNQVQRAYNGLGQLTTEYQAVGGAVNTSTTPKVQYAYTELSAGNNSRPTTLTYPNTGLTAGQSETLTYTYATGLDNTISRLSSITDGTGTLEAYTYLGAGTVVQRAHPQPGVNLTYIQQTGDTHANTDGGDKYTGLDRFGRVIDQNWYKPVGGTSTDRFQYGYDADGNVLYRDNLVNSAFGELYTYDGLNQVASFQRGTLNTAKTGLTGSASRSQSWATDGLGNFTSVTTNGTAQTRTANAQNEVTSVSGSTTPTYDAAGNMTKDETGKQYVYDAWNRLVAVKNAGGTVQETMAYDGLGRRNSTMSGGITTSYYYSATSQVLEEDTGGVAGARFLWSPVYLNAIILRDRSNGGTMNERVWVQQDANWDTTALDSSAGDVVERYDYDPYGVTFVLTAGWMASSGSAYGTVYTYQGMRADTASGLIGSTTRYYSASIGTWVTLDPTLYSAGDNNLYRSDENDPVNHIDPSGLSSWFNIGIFRGPSFAGHPTNNCKPYIWYDQVRGDSIDVFGGVGRWSQPFWAGDGGATAIKNKYGGATSWVSITGKGGFGESGGVCNTPITSTDDPQELKCAGSLLGPAWLMLPPRQGSPDSASDCPISVGNIGHAGPSKSEAR